MREDRGVERDRDIIREEFMTDTACRSRMLHAVVKVDNARTPFVTAPFPLLRTKYGVPIVI